MQIKFKPVCLACGSKEVLIPEDGDTIQMVVCHGCKKVLCSVPELNEKMREASEQAVADHLIAVLEGRVLDDPTIVLEL